jgi:flagellar protein FliO/FliZ
MDTITAASDGPQFLKMIVALVIVIGLMGGLAYVLKKLGLSNGITFKTDEKNRLKILESLPLDARRRLVIIKCDSAEHLVILGATGETVIASDITPVDSSQKIDLPPS